MNISTGGEIFPVNEWFLDTSYIVALASPKDAFHEKAKALAGEIKSQKIRLVTTNGILLELGNALSAIRHRQGAVSLIEAMQADKRVGIVSISDSLLAEGVALFKGRTDKDWGLVDCISFVVMGQRNMGKALTADHHFQQAGFVPLLLA